MFCGLFSANSAKAVLPAVVTEERGPRQLISSPGGGDPERLYCSKPGKSKWQLRSFIVHYLSQKGLEGGVDISTICWAYIDIFGFRSEADFLVQADTLALAGYIRKEGAAADCYYVIQKMGLEELKRDDQYLVSQMSRWLSDMPNFVGKETTGG